MKIKGFFFGAFVIIVFTIISVIIISCEKNKEKEKSVDDGGTTTYITPEGTWTGRDSDYDSSYTISFKNDGTGTFVNKIANSGSGGGYYTHSGSFSYTMTGNNCGILISKLHWSDYPSEYSTEMYYFAKVDNKLFLLEGEDGIVLSHNDDNSSVEGTWTGRDRDYDSSYTLSFNDNGAGTFLNKIANSGSGGGYYSHSGSFSYTMTNKNSGIIIAKLHWSDYPSEYSTEMYYFAKVDNKLYLLEGEDGIVLSHNDDNSSVEGIWTGRDSNYDSSYTLSFNDNGAGTFLNKIANSGSGGGYYSHSGSFSYTMTNKNSGIIIAKLHWLDYPSEYSTEMYYFAIVDNKLYLLEGDDGVVLSMQ